MLSLKVVFIHQYNQYFRKEERVNPAELPNQPPGGTEQNSLELPEQPRGAEQASISHDEAAANEE